MLPQTLVHVFIYLFILILIFSPEEYYLFDILDYVYRLMRKDLQHYTMPRSLYKYVLPQTTNLV